MPATAQPSGDRLVELTGLQTVAHRNAAMMVQGAATVGCNWVPYSIIRKVTVHEDGKATVNPRPPKQSSISIVVPLWWVRKQSNSQRLIANHWR